MKAIRLFARLAEGPGQEIELDAEQARIMTRVLRLKEGQTITLLDGQGGRRLAELLSLNKQQARVKILTVEVDPPAKPEITLVYALPKGEKSSEVIRRSVEWGVRNIIFLRSEFAVAKASKGQAERWQRVAIEAMRQSGNPYLPEIVGALSLEELVEKNVGDLKLLFDTQPGAQVFADFLDRGPSHVAVAVGPEGGWSENERSTLMNHGYQVVKVGPYVLRTENAAVGAVAMIRGLFSSD